MQSDFELIKDLDEQVGVKEHKWYGHEDQTDENLMHDVGSGEPVVIRNYEYALNNFVPLINRLEIQRNVLMPKFMS